MALCNVFGQLFIDELLLHELITHPACHFSCTIRDSGEVGGESTGALQMMLQLFTVPQQFDATIGNTTT